MCPVVNTTAGGHVARSEVPASVADAVGPVVGSADLVLEDLEFLVQGKQTIVRVTVDLPDHKHGAVSLESIAQVSRELSKTLDAVRSLDPDYTLEVSSPGTSRPLTQERHFRRNLGRLVDVRLTDGTRFTERLVDVEDANAVFETRGIVEISSIRKARVEVELSRAEAASDSDFVDIAGTDSDRTQDSED